MTAALAVASMLVVIAMIATDPLSGTARARLFEVDRTAVAAFARQALFVAYLAVLLHALYLWLTRDTRRGKGKEQQRRLGLPLVLFALLVTVIYLYTSNFALPPGEEGVDPDTPITSVPDAEVVPTPASAEQPQPGSPWGAAAIAAALVAVIAYLLFRRPSSEVAEPPVAPAASASQLPTGFAATTDWDPGTDPRSRIFAAYRRVETVAETSGQERRRGETVGAHLRRVAPSLPSRQLASTYNRARFSPHAVAVSDAEAAEASAREIEQELR